jgi:hypothetical protein
MVAAHILKVCSALFEPLVNLKEISENPSRYLFGFGFYAFTALIDMKPPPGALLYIHSASEPYNEEQILSKERVDNWLDKFGMERHQIHYSGHAKGKNLFEIVKTIAAKRCCFQFIHRTSREICEGYYYWKYDCGTRRQNLPYLTVQTNGIFLSDRATFFKSFKTQGIWSLCTSQSNLGYSLH